ncbi:bifunctional 3-(3-hydroxy-phenyl)propionate/3-hydroxycinnamic acid hydroxylase [Erythrobacter sp. F6033]|uniref:bifunctional 3-(3-hydroxy-phenyl)propionate/3-hydroxycinnamic acid hydroxylase MhpA n=1 Tax=Erythrobacter sp. F6033 TaxID=2926401 RepID=UPI001FF1BA6B|nr:bifunctional 3-(3-hydroxy-phenyl)propionate/3-hydroxycinnamic acid hydroxylase [Erythrobacter sp. F6033]
MTSSATIQTDVAIIGAGPTGLMLANLLGLHGVQTTVFEKRKTPFSEPRAIAFDPETLRLFQTVGCYEALSETLELDVPVHYFNANGKTLAHISDGPPSFGHSGRGTYYQPELEAALIKGLADRPSVTLKRGIEVIGLENGRDAVDLKLRSTSDQMRSCSASYVVDCSGGASAVRGQLGIQFEGSTFREKWLVIDVQGDDYEGREIRFFCDPKRPAVTLPVSKNRRRWEFLVMPGDDEVELASHESARALMAGYGAGKADRIERSLVYTFHARFADRFREGRVLLAGDSAHVMPPFAGQGLNSGMRDAANLAWKLAGAVSGVFSDAILDTYEQERRPHVKAMTDLAIELGGTIMPTSAIKAWFRDRIMLTSWRFQRTRDKMNRGDMIPKPSIAGSPLVNWARSEAVGQMIDQPMVQNGDLRAPLDDLLGLGFAAIGVNCDINEELSWEDQAVLDQIGANRVSLSSGSNAANRRDGNEQAGLLAECFGQGKTIALVRPDRFVIDAFAPSKGPPQLAWISKNYAVNQPTEPHVAAKPPVEA